MEIPIELPLDADGFLRRECPHCEREFKWHHGPTDATPPDLTTPAIYWCPLCGESAPLDQWWTKPQVEYQQDAVAGPLHDFVVDELRAAIKPARNDFLRFEVETGERPDAPDPLVEPDDMVLIEPPCHPFEPVKVPEDAKAPFFCLLCGAAYAA